VLLEAKRFLLGGFPLGILRIDGEYGEQWDAGEYRQSLRLEEAGKLAV